jgi:hypothetical protein
MPRGVLEGGRSHPSKPILPLFGSEADGTKRPVPPPFEAMVHKEERYGS